jgi:hypothetical protein
MTRQDSLVGILTFCGKVTKLVVLAMTYVTHQCALVLSLSYLHVVSKLRMCGTIPRPIFMFFGMMF